MSDSSLFCFFFRKCDESHLSVHFGIKMKNVLSLIAMIISSWSFTRITLSICDKQSCKRNLFNAHSFFLHSVDNVCVCVCVACLMNLKSYTNSIKIIKTKLIMEINITKLSQRQWFCFSSKLIIIYLYAFEFIHHFSVNHARHHHIPQRQLHQCYCQTQKGQADSVLPVRLRCHHEVQLLLYIA